MWYISLEDKKGNMTRRSTLAVGMVALLSIPILLGLLAYLLNWNKEHFYSACNKHIAGRRVDVVFLGDSITAAWNGQDPTRLFEDHPGYINRSIAGDHASLMLLRAPQDVFSLEPRTVVFLGGINDLKASTVPNPLRFLMPKEVELSIATMAYLTKAHHERLILCSLTPVNGKEAMNHLGVEPGRMRQDQIVSVNNWMKTFALNHALTYVDYYSAMSDGHDQMRVDLTDDGLHPNSAGLAVMGVLVQHAIGTQQ
jgi:lysophospholipase L1-like esterase